MKTAANAEHEAERFLLDVIKTSPFAGKAFAVGGYVRDQFMGKMPKDLDIMVEMDGGAERLAKWLHDHFPGSISNAHQKGAGYPIWAVVFQGDVEWRGVTYQTKGAELEFADSQKEMFPDPNSRQRITQFGTKEEDTARRDFTVNMLLKDLSTGEVLDLTGVSKSDITDGILRGHPEVDFNMIIHQDPLRMLRLVRFQVKYGWKVAQDVIDAVRANASRIEIISGERIQGELVKIMELGKTAQAVRFMQETGLLPYVLPEIEALRGVEHDKVRGIHQEGDVYNHTMLVLEHARPTMEAQLAALLHDVGKPATQKLVGEKIMFLGHEKVGGEMAEAIMRRLKFDGGVIKRVRKQVELHMRMHSLPDAKESKLRAFIRDIGEEMTDALLDITEADTKGNLGSPPEFLERIQKLRDRIRQIKDSPVPVSRKPVLNGDRICAILGIKPGPIIKEVISYLLSVQDDYAERGQTLSTEEAEKMVVEQFGTKTASAADQPFRGRRMTMAREAGLKEVVNRIYRHIRDSEWAKSMVERVTRFTQTHDKKDDLAPDEVRELYHDVDLDKTVPLSKKRDLVVDWSDHAKFRCHLRDVNPVDVEQTVEEVMTKKVHENRLDRNKVQLKRPGVGTMVVDYNLLTNPAEADIVTVWASTEGAMDTLAIAERVATATVIEAWGSHSSYKGDPYWITVKYQGVCSKCSKPIERGDKAFYYPRQKKMYGEKCGCGTEAANDFHDQAEAEDFLGGNG